MRAVFGLLLIMMGLAAAVVWLPEKDERRQLAAVTDIATQGIGPRVAATGAGSLPERQVPGEARTFSPGMPLLSSSDLPVVGAVQHAAAARVLVPLPQERMRTVVSTQADPGEFAGGRVVVLTPVLTAGAGGNDAGVSRDELVRTMQRELQRVGCYAGEIDGNWGSGSRRALATFMDRLNASLPADQPDSAALALVGAQSGIVCGRACPGGQTLDGERCVLNAVLARRKPVEAPLQVAAVSPAEAGQRGVLARSPRVEGDRGASPGSIDATLAATAAVAAAGTRGPATMAGLMAVGALSGQTRRSSVVQDAGLPAARGMVAGGLSAADQPGVRPSRRERSQRSRRGPSYAGPAPRSFGGPVVVYRAPRVASGPTYYAPRRGRAWTATFFGP
jgi:peptidoglycan hydrolase-like protein with peptidoglycan-binding domain